MHRMARKRIVRKKQPVAEPQVVKKKTKKAKTSGPKPKYHHYCGGCIFLGTLERPSILESKKVPTPCDLYVCPTNRHFPTVLARYSSEPSEYYSGLRFALNGLVPELVEALKRAVEKGILGPDGQVVLCS